MSAVHARLRRTGGAVGAGHERPLRLFSPPASMTRKDEVGVDPPRSSVFHNPRTVVSLPSIVVTSVSESRRGMSLLMPVSLSSLFSSPADLTLLITVWKMSGNSVASPDSVAPDSVALSLEEEAEASLDAEPDEAVEPDAVAEPELRRTRRVSETPSSGPEARARTPRRTRSTLQTPRRPSSVHLSQQKHRLSSRRPSCQWRRPPQVQSCDPRRHRRFLRSSRTSRSSLRSSRTCLACRRSSCVPYSGVSR